jgi:IS1 family transposase/transposase-like protein
MTLNTERGPRLGRRHGLIRRRREPVPGLSSILPRSAGDSLCSPFSGSHKRFTRPCRSLSIRCRFNELEFGFCHADFQPCRLPLVRGLGRPAHSFVFHAVIVRKKTFRTSLIWILSFRTISTDKKSCWSAETLQQPSTIELSPKCGLRNSILGESSQLWEVFAVVVSTCQHDKTQKYGKDRKGNTRRRCTVCGATFTETGVRPLGSMRIDLKDACRALAMLLEGMSIRAVERISGLNRDTLCDLVLVAGDNCEALLSEAVRGVEAKDVQCDEIWSFVGCKERTRHAARYTGDEGHSWTWIAVERNTKLVLAHQVGQRDGGSCELFLNKLDRATVGRFQLSADGLGAYTLNVPFTFRDRVDFGQLIKNYGGGNTTGRYSPAKIINSQKKAMYGSPDHDRICTSHIERLNLTLRMNVRRFTRLTNAHSKSLKHHRAMQALFFAFYNFCRKHESIGQTPAMAAGLTKKAWTIRELLENAAGKNS